MICGFLWMKGGIWETNCQLHKTGTGRDGRETRLPLCHKKTTWQIICWEIGGVLLKTPHMTLKQYALGNIDSDHIWSIFKKI